METLLFRLNFNDVWEAHSADDPQLFIRTLRQRMIAENDNNGLINLNCSNFFYLR